VLSRPVQVTDGGNGYTSYVYTDNDVLVSLGPAPTVPVTENPKSRQLEYDGLGRLTSVCELTGTTNGGGKCGQSNKQTGYWTTYTYNHLTFGVTENSQGTSQTRSYVYDNLGRLASETNPEWGPGTATYTYDSDSSGACPGPYKGDLVKALDNAGNTKCYAYDGIHRLSSTSYSGTNPTTNRYFVYDSATVNGQNMTYAAGRMAEAYTATCPTCAKVTDEGFGYNQRGDFSNFYESTPHSAGYYFVPMTYWANGQIKTFGPFLTEPQYSVTPDGEGRPLDIAGGGSAASGITYNMPSGQPTGNQPVQIMTSCAGSTCYPINYQYDSNTLRMTSYSAAGSNGTLSGTMTWNPNGSLQQLVIADPVNAADAQTCTYSADDLARISSVSCNSGSTWGQQFTYDPFGNITKSVPAGATGISWLPGYNSSTNRYLLLGGTGYDGNGNVLNDTFNQYTWDAEGKNLSTVYSSNGETWNFTYDAFGHKVEWLLNGSYHMSYITLGRFKLQALGQTVAYSEYPFPGGSLSSLNGGATGVQIADWLGTVRGFFNYTGGTVNSTVAHAPFGETYAGDASSFTGQQTDDGNIYNFPERRYASSQGRWLSPDPAGSGAVDPSNPQSWNRYAYVMNNPLRFIDPSGMILCDYGPSDNGGEDFEDADDESECTGNGGTLPSDQTIVNVNGDTPDDAGTTIENGEQVFPLIAANNGNQPLLTPNQQKALHCLGQTVKAKGLSIGLDVAGSIPGFGNLFSGAAAGIQGLNAAYYGTVSLANAGNTLLNPSASGAANTAATAGFAVASLTLSGSKAIPVVGTIVSLGFLAYDIAGPGGAISTYQQCMAGPG